jgi:hypothetical protein
MLKKLVAVSVIVNDIKRDMAYPFRQQAGTLSVFL